MGRIKAIITDFDGTLVDTFMANFLAYHEVFKNYGYLLTKEQYRACYGLRFDAFCDKMNIPHDIRNGMTELKKNIYPSYFKYIELNQSLMMFIRHMKSNGVRTCIASTAASANLYNVLNYFGIGDNFDIVITGEHVSKGKPNPEVYLKALALLECEPDEAIVFEDSDVGCEAAENAEISYIRIQNF